MLLELARVQLGLAQQVQPETQKQPVLLGLAGQAPPKLFAEVDRALCWAVC